VYENRTTPVPKKENITMKSVEIVLRMGMREGDGVDKPNQDIL
jgi:hypothetical protein